MLLSYRDTCEHLDVMFEDVPTKARKYFKRLRQNDTMRKDNTTNGL